MAEKINYKDYPSSAKELRAFFNVSLPTWSKWLIPIKDKIRINAKVYQPHEVKTIVEFLEGQ